MDNIESFSEISPDVDLRNPSSAGFLERVAPEDFAEEPQHLSRYLFAAHWVPGRAVVEFCCGVGYGANILRAAGAQGVLGVDIDRAVVAAATRRFGSQEVQFTCADVTTPLELHSADVAICFEGIEHVANPDNLLENLTRCLKKDGVAILSTPNGGNYPTGHSGNPYHLREYQRDEWQELLSRHFDVVENFFQWDSGDPYNFTWNLHNLVKAFLPIPLKHFLRKKLIERTQELGGPSFANGTATSYWSRPFPNNYLSLLPGLRQAQPSIWLAVCKQPKKK